MTDHNIAVNGNDASADYDWLPPGDNAFVTQALITDNPVQCNILADVVFERRRQVTKWGPQRHPDLAVTDLVAQARKRHFARLATHFKRVNDDRERCGDPGVWVDILLEELYEALEAGSRAELRKELIETMAVAAAWIEDIDTRATLADG